MKNLLNQFRPLADNEKLAFMIVKNLFGQKDAFLKFLRLTVGHIISRNASVF